MFVVCPVNDQQSKTKRGSSQDMDGGYIGTKSAKAEPTVKKSHETKCLQDDCIIRHHYLFSQVQVTSPSEDYEPVA